MITYKRKIGQKIYIGSDIIIEVVDCNDKHAKISIEAPENSIVLRGEVLEAVKEINQQANNEELIDFLRKQIELNKKKLS